MPSPPYTTCTTPAACKRRKRHVSRKGKQATGWGRWWGPQGGANRVGLLGTTGVGGPLAGRFGMRLIARWGRLSGAVGNAADGVRVALAGRVPTGVPCVPNGAARVGPDRSHAAGPAFLPRWTRPGGGGWWGQCAPCVAAGEAARRAAAAAHAAAAGGGAPAGGHACAAAAGARASRQQSRRLEAVAFARRLPPQPPAPPRHRLAARPGEQQAIGFTLTSGRRWATRAVGAQSPSRIPSDRGVAFGRNISVIFDLNSFVCSMYLCVMVHRGHSGNV